MRQLNFIDLFSGAGGLSEGFINAGFEPIAHVEIDAKACETLETRLIYHKLKSEDKLKDYYKYILGDISRSDFLEKNSSSTISNSVINTAIGGDNNKVIFAKIDNLVKGKPVDLIVGGPPC